MRLLAFSVKIVFREDALRDIKCCSNNRFLARRIKVAGVDSRFATFQHEYKDFHENCA
jgi:hypothetical protein